MAYSHIRFIPYHTPTIYLAGSARQELPAGMLLDYKPSSSCLWLLHALLRRHRF